MRKKKNSLVRLLRPKSPVPHRVPKPVRQTFCVLVCPIPCGTCYTLCNIAQWGAHPHDATVLYCLAFPCSHYQL